MADYRYRSSGRRSPTFNPARASLPLSVGYSSPYGGDIHAIPTARYESTGPRRQNTHHGTPTATVTTYNVTKDPLTRSTSVRDNSRTRHRSTTFDTGSGTVKPIIVTTNHTRPHNSSSHASSGRSGSPFRDPYRASQESYYAQPASSIPSRSHHRHYSATLDNDEFFRLRERVGGDDRLQTPIRPHSRQSMYVNPPPRPGSAIPLDFGMDDYEYTKPSDLARYDLDHDRPRSRSSRRDSIDRGTYYRPSVSVVSSDTSRPEGRRGPPPPSVGLERYNRKAAAGIYDRPSIVMPALPAVPPPPPIDPARRPGLLDAPGSPTTERRSSRPRPVSLYQEPAPRMSQADDMYRARDDERSHRERRDRERNDDLFRPDSIASRGFGIRPEFLEQAEHRRPSEPERRDYDDRRTRREPEEREPKRRSDENLEKVRGRDERKGPDVKDRPARVEESRDRKDSKDTGRGEKVREKVAAGLGVAAAAIGLGGVAKDKEEDKEGKVSPRRRRDSEVDLDLVGTRPADRYKPRERDVERKTSPREEPIVVEQRRELPKKERIGSRDNSVSREKDGGRELEREKERERDLNRREAEAKLSGTKVDTRDNSPKSDDSAGLPSRRRRRPSSAFNPTDTKGLMDLKAQLAAMEVEDKPKEKERSVARDRPAEADAVVSTASEKQSVPVREHERDRPQDEPRGRELSVVEPEVKQVRVVSPPREKGDQKPVKGILKQPKPQFPEEPNPIREGVAPHKDDKTKKDVPPGARWTKINRKMVNPEALTIGKERFEVRDDFVIVLRVLSKEEIQAYATATAQLRERRRLEYEKENEGDEKDRGRDRDEDERRRRHRHRRDREDEDDDRKDRDRDRDGDKERHRRRRHDDYDQEEQQPRPIDYGEHSSHHHHRSHRDKDRESVSTITDDRR